MMQNQIPVKHVRAPWPSVFQAFVVLSILYVCSVWLIFTLAPIVKSWSLPEGLSWPLSYLTTYGVATLVFVTAAAWRGRFRESLFAWRIPQASVSAQITLIALINLVASAGIVTLFLHQTYIQSDPVTNLNIFHVVTSIVIAPAIEETLFRGIMLHAFLKQLKPQYAVVVSSILFTLFHEHPARMFVAFPMGLLLGWLYFQYRSIVPTILLHACINVAAIALSFLRLRLYPHLPEPGSGEFVLLTLAALAALGATVVWTMHLHKTLTISRSAAPLP